MDSLFARWQPAALSLFRFITGLLLFQYGVAKVSLARALGMANEGLQSYFAK